MTNKSNEKVNFLNLFFAQSHERVLTDKLDVPMGYLSTDYVFDG